MAIAQAIVTTSVAPDRHGDRSIHAAAQWGTAIHGWTDALNVEDNHRNAAVEFACDRGWLRRDDNAKLGRIMGGAMPTRDGIQFAWIVLDAPGVK